MEELAARAAQDFDDFYAARELAAEEAGDLLVLSFDGKRIAMRREDLRPETRKAAESTPRRLRTRLTRGEKRHRKRMAEVAAVYTVAAYVRNPRDLLADLRPVRDVARDRDRPRPTNKRVWASVKKSTEDVIGDAFDEARRRDPAGKRRWVVLLDGNRDQLRLVKKAARKVGASVTIIVDLIHVLEYLWKAAYAFHADGSNEAEAWVQQRLMWLLQGAHAKVRTNIRRNARDRGLEGAALTPVAKCLRYLRGVRHYLAYDAALADGLPIATGVMKAPAATSSRTAWRRRARAGRSPAQTLSFVSGPFERAATSTPTGPSTSIASISATIALTTRPARHHHPYRASGRGSGA